MTPARASACVCGRGGLPAIKLFATEAAIRSRGMVGAVAVGLSSDYLSKARLVGHKESWKS